MPKKLEDDFKKIDKFLYLTKTIDKFQDCKDIYELFGITDKDASYLEIEAKISEFVNKYARMDGPDYKHLKRTVSGEAETIKRILKENKKEFDQYSKEKHKKALVKFFEFATEVDKQLQPDEEENLIREGKKLGFGKSEVINFIDELLQSYKVRRGVTAVKEFSVDALARNYYELLNVPEDADYKKIKVAYDREHRKYINSRDKVKASAIFNEVIKAWECLKDTAKRREYDEKLRRERESGFTREGDPKLEIQDESGQEKRSFDFKNMRLGATSSVTLTVKNGGGGTLDAKVKTNRSWLIVDTSRIHQSKLPQRITIIVDPRKVKSCNKLGGNGKGEIKIAYKNGAYEKEEIISVNFNIEIEEEALGRFKINLSSAFALLGIPVGHIVEHYFGNPSTDFFVSIAGIIAGIKVFSILSDEGGRKYFLINIGAWFVYLVVVSSILDEGASFFYFLMFASLFFLLGRLLSKKLFHYGKDIIHIIWTATGILSLVIIVFFSYAKQEQEAKTFPQESVKEQKVNKIKPSRLFVETDPANCGIKIMNIKPKFYQGMKLDPGRYHIEVSANGHKTVNTWVELSAGEDKTINIGMKKNEKIITNPRYSSGSQIGKEGKKAHFYKEEQNAERFFEEIFSKRHRLTFFESGYIRPKKLFYQSVFHKNKTRYINYLLKLKHKAPGCRIEFPIVAVYKRSSGTIFARFTNNSYVERTTTNSYHSLGNGWKKTGNWPIDSYKVELFVKGKKISSSNFKVID